MSDLLEDVLETLHLHAADASACAPPSFLHVDPVEAPMAAPARVTRAVEPHPSPLLEKLAVRAAPLQAPLSARSPLCARAAARRAAHPARLSR